MTRADDRLNLGNTPDDGPEFDPITLDQFRATGRDCANLGAVLEDESLAGLSGRLYCQDELWIALDPLNGPWTVLGNTYHYGPLEVLEGILRTWAEAEGYGHYL